MLYLGKHVTEPQVSKRYHETWIGGGWNTSDRVCRQCVKCGSGTN